MNALQKDVLSTCNEMGHIIYGLNRKGVSQYLPKTTTPISYTKISSVLNQLVAMGLLEKNTYGIVERENGTRNWVDTSPRMFYKITKDGKALLKSL